MILTGLFLCALAALSDDKTAHPGPAVEPASPLARIAVIGASASAGFGTRVTLAEALGLQITCPHAEPVNLADSALFLNPGALGETQVERAVALKPTLVVAPDFLFWFGYGEVANEEERLENLDLGLELLGSLTCPLVLSRFPDMSDAVGKMLMASQMPEQATLVQLDQRLEIWAERRGRVVFAPMREYVAQLRGDEKTLVAELEIQGAPWRRRLMQSDDLHPTAEGLGVLARLCLDSACKPAVGVRAEHLAAKLEPVLPKLAELNRSRGAAVIDVLAPPQPKDPAPKPLPGGGKSAAERFVLRR